MLIMMSILTTDRPSLPLDESDLGQMMSTLEIPHQLRVPLGPLTWYRLGGPAAVLAKPHSFEQLAILMTQCSKLEVPVYVLGSGANLLVADKGVGGVVIRLEDSAFKKLTIEGSRVTVGAGYDLAKLVHDTARAGLSGLECMAGIPATVGGAIRMNAGGAFGEIGTSVARVRVMDSTGDVYDLGRNSLEFGYRHSNISEPLILEAEFELQAAPWTELRQRVKDIFAYKKDSQPMADKSAGCVFKNPKTDPRAEGASAGKLIDQAGLKGFAVGGAEVSEVHANFIVTKPGAKASDVLAVMSHVQETVMKRFSVHLVREVVVWPA
jgi:UDP-N-acetylmuramate dehydrogenase